MEPWDVVIVGAGVSGITLGHLLDDAGKRVLLLDKGRAPGGRVSSKTLDGSLLDSAADHAVTNDSAVMDVLSRFAGAKWAPAGTGSVWSFAEPARVTMQGFAGTLPIQHTFVSHLVKGENERLGVMRHGFGEPVWAKTVVLTMPVPQAQAIIAHSDFVLDYSLDDLSYTKRQVLLTVFDGDGHDPDSAWSTDIIEKVRYRPRPDGLLGVEAFATEAWSEATWDLDATICQGRLLRELGLLFDNARVWGSDVMRWRYALPRNTSDARSWTHPEIPRLHIIGDVFGGPDNLSWGISKAVQSALGLAQQLV